jgi:hypothetical protein
MKTVNELSSSKNVNRAACSYDRQGKRAGINYSTKDRAKAPKKKA